MGGADKHFRFLVMNDLDRVKGEILVAVTVEPTPLIYSSLPMRMVSRGEIHPQ